MTCKIKRRSLRCGGRPKADFGSIFTTFIAPALGVAGSVADSAISKTQVSKSNTKPAVKETNTEVTNNNTSVENLPTIQVPTKDPISGLITSNTVLPPDPTKTPTMRLGGRKKCWIGAAIGAATSIAGSLFGNGAKKREMRRQKSIQDWQNTTQEAANMTTALNNSQDYQEDYLRQFRTAARLGKTLGAKGIYITDGGDATKIGNNTYLLRGGSHEDVNETGQTGIGINVGGNEVEAEGGEVAQKKNGALRIFSAQPILGNGMSPAQAILRGYNKDKVFNAQQAFKRRNDLKDDGSKAKHGTEVPYKRIHINEDGTFTDTLTGKNYNTSATNGEDVVITGKANHWKEAGKKDTSSYFDPMGAINFITAAGAPILNANPSNIVGSIRDSKNASDFLKHYMMQDTGGFVNTKWAKEHPYLSLGINTIGDIGLGIGTNKAVDILRHPLEYGKYGYKLNKLYKKAGLLNRGEYKTIQENYEKLLDYYVGKRPYDEGALDYTYDVKASRNAEHVNPDLFYSYVYPNKEERIAFKRAYRKKATDNVFTEMTSPIRYGFDFGKSNDVKTYHDLMNHNPEYYEFLKETRLPWDEQSTVDEFLKRQQTSLRGVYADNKDDAVRYLTQILARRKGGDRLNTHGGLYTSNSTGIADAFKNPDDGISNGYIGKLLYDFDIDKTKPIADQLRQARMKIVRGRHNNVFAGSKYYDESINDARRKGAVAVEDNYGRSNGDVLNVTERAYFPGSAKQNKLTLQNLEEYLAQENQRGRWNTNGVDKMKGDEKLFIPREYNRFDDFIREARIFMKPRRLYDTNKSDKFFNELYSKNMNRSEYRNKLIDMSRRLLRRNERYSDKFDVRKEIPIIDFDEPFRFGGRCKLRNGGLTSKDRGSSNHPYPSVSSKDFAGSGRSYPIPTKADAVDALRLAGLHGRSDVKAKVYSRYPELRKKARGGAKIEPYYDWARNTSSNLGISFIDPDYDYRAYYNSVTPYERNLIRFAPKETHFTDIGKTPKHATFSNESKYSNDKTPGGTWNGNVFVPNIWQFGNNGNNRRNKYMNNSGEGYFNGRVNVFPTSRKRHSLGGCSRPVKGIRPKAATGIFVPYNKRYTSIYDAPDYSSDYNGGNVLGNGEVTVTAKRIKPTFMKPNNDAMNIINHPANETPYIPQRHNRSRTIFSGGDYLGLGIDTLAALSTGLVNYNTAGKYVLPDRAPIIQASKLPTTYNVNPEIEEVKRYRDRLTGQTFNNTSSSVAALNRSGAINLDALSNLSKLWATKENEENKMLTEDAKNQQIVAAQNVQNELARQSEIARIKNEANQAKGDALNVGLSGLSQAWTNFWTAGRTAYEDDQTRRAMIASSKDATPTRLMEMDFDLSPDVIAALYRSANEDRTKRFYLSRLSPKQRQKYGIN